MAALLWQQDLTPRPMGCAQSDIACGDLKMWIEQCSVNVDRDQA